MLDQKKLTKYNDTIKIGIAKYARFNDKNDVTNISNILSKQSYIKNVFQ